MSTARETRVAASGVIRCILTGIGVVCVGLGIVGIFVPLLPTTPFLLLAAACFVRSSERFHKWLMTNRLVGGHLRSYMEHRATTLATKVGSIATLWCALALAAALFTENWVVRSMLLLIGVGVTVHLVTLRTIAKKPSSCVHLQEGAGKKRAQWRLTASHRKPVDNDRSSITA